MTSVNFPVCVKRWSWKLISVISCCRGGWLLFYKTARLTWLRCTFAQLGPHLEGLPDLNHHWLCNRRVRQILGTTKVLLSTVSKQIGLKEQELWAAKSLLGKHLKEEKTYCYQYDLLLPDIHWQVNAVGNNFKLYRFLKFSVKHWASLDIEREFLSVPSHVRS